jgi:hypothetical protein
MTTSETIFWVVAVLCIVAAGALLLAACIVSFEYRKYGNAPTVVDTSNSNAKAEELLQKTLADPTLDWMFAPIIRT